MVGWPVRPTNTRKPDITYAYDNGGNRTAKENTVSHTRVVYRFRLARAARQ